jgi:hypothetical protein
LIPGIPVPDSTVGGGSEEPPAVSNPIDFNWTRGGWGESCCGGRGTRIQIDTQSDFSFPDAGNAYDSDVRDDFTEDSVELNLDFDPGVYYWRVRQYNQIGGHWSEPEVFRFENSPPECQSITGPTFLRWPGASTLDTAGLAGMFNVEARDVDMNAMTYEWSSPDCAAELIEVPVDYFVVRARGREGDGAFPIMNVYIVDDAGVRSPVGSCDGTTLTDSLENYTCDLNPPQSIASVDIVYANDNDSGNRTMRVDWVGYYFVDGSNRRVQAESNADDGDHVFYDRARTNIPFMEQMTDPFDGMDVEDGTDRMDVNGSLRFPVPILFNTVSSGSLCTLSVRAADRHGASDNNSICNYPVDICGEPPGQAINGYPHNVFDFPLDGAFTWDPPPGGFGDICVGSETNTYTVYGRLKPPGELFCPRWDNIPEQPGDPDNYFAVPECTNMPASPNPSCDSSSFDVENADYCWYVVTSNGEYYAFSDVWTFETEHSLVGKNWFTTIGGDLYATGISGAGGGIPMELPEPDDYAVNQIGINIWSPPFINHQINRFGVTIPTYSLSSLEMNINDLDPDEEYSPESESDFFAENAYLSRTWPHDFDGEPPNDASGNDEHGIWCVPIFSNTNLDPNTTYKMNVDCAQLGLINTTYELSEDGVVVVYVTGSGDLRFDQEFKAENPNQRIVFVTGPGVNVIVDRTLSSPDPVDIGALNPLIEAAFVVAGEGNYFEFEGTPDPDGPLGSDLSVIVEGPIIAKQVRLNRDRDLQNYFPAEIVKYNSYYMHYLTQREREGDLGSDYTGLFITDTDWISEE